MKTAVIDCQNLSLRLGHNQILRNCSVAMQPQESFVLLGHSGSGKSIFLKALLQLVSFQEGQIFWEQKNMQHLSQKHQQSIRRRSGVVFQGSALFDSLSVWENIAFTLLNPPNRLPTEKARQAALHVMDKVKLPSKTADLLPNALSGGMKRLTAFARAILLKPCFLFLDEPTAGLDPVFSRMIGQLICDLQKTLQATTLTITHDLDLAEKIQHKTGFLYEGKIAFQGHLQAIKNESTAAIADFFKAPKS